MSSAGQAPMSPQRMGECRHSVNIDWSAVTSASKMLYAQLCYHSTAFPTRVITGAQGDSTKDPTASIP
jgi:hypothetical protein